MDIGSHCSSLKISTSFPMLSLESPLDLFCLSHTEWFKVLVIFLAESRQGQHYWPLASLFWVGSC
jgi:hypothetical protein